MTQPSDKEKLFARRKAYNELRRKIQERPGYSLVSPKDMTPFDRYMSDNLIAPPAVVDWGLCEFKNASPELLQLQSYHRQATSDEVPSSFPFPMIPSRPSRFCFRQSARTVTGKRTSARWFLTRCKDGLLVFQPVPVVKQRGLSVSEPKLGKTHQHFGISAGRPLPVRALQSAGQRPRWLFLPFSVT